MHWPLFQLEHLPGPKKDQNGAQIGIFKSKAIYVKVLSLHIVYKNGNFFAEVVTVMWQFKKWYDKNQKHLSFLPIE